jgi:hypothetical protein
LSSPAAHVSIPLLASPLPLLPLLSLLSLPFSLLFVCPFSRPSAIRKFNLNFSSSIWKNECSSVEEKGKKNASQPG